MKRRFLILAGFLCALGAACQTPASARVLEVEFPSGDAKLAGTIHLPSGGSPRWAVVLLGGSDRSARGPMKTKLARALAESGVAVLVYDSPGTGGSGGNAFFQTRRDRAQEAVAAADFLRSTEAVGSATVGVWGGSEGATVALLAAGLDPGIAFAVAVSGGFGVSMLDLSRFRIEAMGLRRGLGAEDIDRARALEDILYSLMTGLDVVEWRLVRARIAKWPDEPWEELIRAAASCREDLTEARQQAVWDSLRNILRGWMSEPWFDVAIVDRGSLERVLALDAGSFFRLVKTGSLARGDWYQGRDELDLLSQVHCPVLAVWGEEDDFLPAHRCAAWLKASLEATGNREVTCRVMPGGDHFLGGAGALFLEGYPGLAVEWLASRFPATGGR